MEHISALKTASKLIFIVQQRALFLCHFGELLMALVRQHYPGQKLSSAASYLGAWSNGLVFDAFGTASRRTATYDVIMTKNKITIPEAAFNWNREQFRTSVCTSIKHSIKREVKELEKSGVPTAFANSWATFILVSFQRLLVLGTHKDTVLDAADHISGGCDVLDFEWLRVPWYYTVHWYGMTLALNSIEAILSSSSVHACFKRAHIITWSMNKKLTAQEEAT